MITYESLCEKVGVDILVGVDKQHWVDEDVYEDAPVECTPEEEKLIVAAQKLSEEELDLLFKIRITKDKTLTA
ncbi:hypothetical protein KG089_01245 [Carnobacteriaceae bacterium zg-ZUI252]|nr:hypothetical protein [Carnobacteriaceae bacterium zg-ZUI252]